MKKLITIQDRLEWIHYVNKAAEYDFYHTWHYHSLETTDTPLLFVYEQNQDFIAIPLLKRSIPESTYFDLTCVYGFSGPFSNKKMKDLDDDLIEQFKADFLKFLDDEKIVSVFCRMHPFYPQQLVLEKFGGVCDNGKTVVMDLSVNIEEQRRKYKPKTRRAINIAREKGYRLVEESGAQAIKTFFELYSQSMKRVGASEYYYFNENYFSKVVNTEEYDARIVMVYDGDIVIASTIIMLTNGIMQGHLIGVRPEYVEFSPIRYLVDELTIFGRIAGINYFNLGGGVGFKEDNVFQGKIALTDLTFDYKSWRYIANPCVYKQLLAQKGINEDTDVDFFPLYRYA
jgi:hypothetical protein